MTRNYFAFLGLAICCAFLFAAYAPSTSAADTKQKSPISFLPAKGFVALGTLTKYKELAPNTWTINVTDVEVLIGHREKGEENDIEISLLTGLGGVLVSPDKDWIGEKVLFLVEEQGKDYIVPKTHNPLSPNGEPFFLFSPKSDKIIRGIRKASNVFALENEERKVKFIQLAEAASKQQVAAAFQKVRSGDYSLVQPLQKDAAATVPYLAEYVTDKNEDVRAEVVSIASLAGTPEAISILSELSADKDGYVSEHAVTALYDMFECSRLREVGGITLKNNLLTHLENKDNSAKTILLLMCFSEDKEVVHALETHRKSATGLTKLKPWHPVVDLAVCIDLSLAEIGNADAEKRVMEYVEQGEINNLIFILTAIKFVDSKPILTSLVELLKDNRDALPGAPSGSNFYLRVSDLAIQALVKKTGIKVEFDTKARRHFTKQERSFVYGKLKRYFNVN